MGNEIEKKQGSQLVQYGSFDLSEMQKEAEALPTSFASGYTAKQGKNIVRFLPPLKGRKPMKAWHKHFFSAGGDTKAIVCAKFQSNQPCPLCDKGQQLRASGNRADAEAAKAYQPRSSMYVNVVDMQEPEKGVQVWKMSPGLFKDIMAAIEMADVGSVFADPVKGYNIVFKRTGEKMNTKYTGHTVAREASTLPNAEELITSQVDLETVEQLPSDEDQDKAMEGEFEVRGSDNKRSGGGRRQERDVTPKASEKEDIEY